MLQTLQPLLLGETPTDDENPEDVPDSLLAAAHIQRLVQMNSKASQLSRVHSRDDSPEIESNAESQDSDHVGGGH